MNKTCQRSLQSFSWLYFILFFLHRGIERKKKKTVFNVFWETLLLLEVYFIGPRNRQLNESLSGWSKLWGTSPSNRRCKRTSRWRFKISSHLCYITKLFICKRAVKSKEAATICKKHESRLAQVPHTITCTLTHSHPQANLQSACKQAHKRVCGLWEGTGVSGGGPDETQRSPTDWSQIKVKVKDRDVQMWRRRREKILGTWMHHSLVCCYTIPFSSIISQVLIGLLQMGDTTGLGFKCDGTFVPEKTNGIVLLFKPH